MASSCPGDEDRLKDYFPFPSTAFQEENTWCISVSYAVEEDADKPFQGVLVHRIYIGLKKRKWNENELIFFQLL